MSGNTSLRPPSPSSTSLPPPKMTSLASAFQSPLSRFKVLQWRRPFSPPNRYPRTKPKKPKPRTLADDYRSRSFEFVIDPSRLSYQASSSLKTLIRDSRSRFDRFVFSGREALEDLQTLVTVDRDRRILISCRQATLEFAGHFILWSFVIVFASRVLGGLGLGFRRRFGFGYGGLVRRDRSLAGREVVVAKKKKMGFRNRVLGNPLSPPRDETLPRNADKVPRRAREPGKLPRWWSDSDPQPVMEMSKEEHQREAQRLIRAIMESRMSGKDIMEDDIIRLRQICRTSKTRVSFDTANARDSFYRAAVDFVLNICSRAAINSSPIQINGEGAQQFVSGLANNIGIENIYAARIVSAAVAGRTRSCLLQAWALKMQGKHSEAVAELSKICSIHSIFPPEEASPELEMVALGLEKHLKVEQRKFIFDILVKSCGEECRRSVAEALGLVCLLES